MARGNTAAGISAVATIQQVTVELAGAIVEFHGKRAAIAAEHARHVSTVAPSRPTGDWLPSREQSTVVKHDLPQSQAAQRETEVIFRRCGRAFDPSFERSSLVTAT